MTSIVTKYAAKKLLGKQMEKYKKKDVAGDNDPYFVLIEDPRRKGKVKKVKKQIPDYIPEHDAIILAKMRKRAYWLDCSLFNLFGVRFGWSSVIGLIPAFGDAVDTFLAFALFLRCRKVECGLDNTTQLLMLFNIFADFLVGLIPFIGDMADAAFRANSKNVRLLEKCLDKAYKPENQKKRESTLTHPPPPATVYEEFSDEEAERRSPTYSGTASPARAEPAHPQPARAATETKGGERTPSKKSNYGSKRERQPDLEMGRAGSRV